MDVLQLDIRRGGFLGCLDMARLGEPAGALTIPHNWGSQVGVRMGLQLSKAVPSVPAAEDDRSSCDAIIAEKYVFKDGFYTVPDAPGLGIDLNGSCLPAELSGQGDRGELRWRKSQGSPSPIPRAGFTSTSP